MGEQEGEHLPLDFRLRLEVTLSLQPTVTSFLSPGLGEGCLRIVP